MLLLFLNADSRVPILGGKYNHAKAVSAVNESTGQSLIFWKNGGTEAGFYVTQVYGLVCWRSFTKPVRLSRIHKFHLLHV